MPRQSEEQRKSAAVALAAKRGRFDSSKLEGAERELYENMDEYQLAELAYKSVDEKDEQKE